MTEIIHYNHDQFMPALSIDQSIDRYNAVVEFVRQVMKQDIDYGVIPGTNKPTLLKPGAERLCMFFGLSIRFQLVEKVEDWTGKEHDGEPFFYYMYRCQLYRGDVLIAESDASCNSFEKKYRYRNADRLCPACGQPAILKSKKDSGWFCWTKKGGCGANFQAGDPSIEQQEVGRVHNPEIADIVNTLQKMAQKRAMIGATLLAVNASEFFTQDVEDLVIEVPARPTNVDTATGEVVVSEHEQTIARIEDLLKQERALQDHLGQIPMPTATGNWQKLPYEELRAIGNQVWKSVKELKYVVYQQEEQMKEAA